MPDNKNISSRTDICLALMPYGVITNPAVALGVLKASLAGSGMSCAARYANLEFASEIGTHRYRFITSFSLYLLGELTFSHVAFPEYRPDISGHLATATRRFFSRYFQHDATDSDIHSVTAEFEDIRRRASKLVDRVADEILAMHPAVVACNSTFEQHVASLALLRRIKERRPEVVTLVGGANCEASMGVVTVREFDWIDVVFSGEADAVFPELCANLIADGPDISADRLPYGAINREMAKQLTDEGVVAGDVPRAVLEDVDRAPIPDFREYFDTLASLPLGDVVKPGITMEGSRGCWWGARKGCTFCGLNGAGKRYRAKSPDRVIREFATLAERHGIDRFEMVDNIMDMNWFKTVLPELRELGKPYYIFCEAKANLSRDRIRQIAEAGVLWLQPGIESLHDQHLALMNKGATAMTNLQTLKYAREFGMHASWNILVGFPDEPDEWLADMASWIPKIFHFPPPTAVVPIKLQRFSAYHDNPEAYGLNLAPIPGYPAVFPLDPTSMNDLAYSFCDDKIGELPVGRISPLPGVKALEQRVRDWRKCYNAAMPVVLCMTEKDNGIEIFDTRPCAVKRTRLLHGAHADVIAMSDPGITRGKLMERLNRETGEEIAPDRFCRVIDELKQADLVLEIDGKIFALPIRGDIPDPVPGFPGGDMPADRFIAYVESLCHKA